MHGYSQPADYRFSHDSIELAQRAFDEIRRRRSTGLREIRGLDLCAGCGVVGLELIHEILRTSELQTTPDRLTFDFNEVQDAYRPHFERNVEWIRRRKGPAAPAGSNEFEARWLEGSYASLLSPSFENVYDVVVANPPYFDRENGSLPPSDFKARCRFFVDSDFETLCRVVRHVLKPEGIGYILVRDPSDHGETRASLLEQVFSNGGSWTWLEPVRGTGLVRFQKAILESQL